MTSNFKIFGDKNSDGFGLNLAGDFEATSAYELIYPIKKLPDDALRIFARTDGLKTVSPPGAGCFSQKNESD